MKDTKKEEAEETKSCCVNENSCWWCHEDVGCRSVIEMLPYQVMVREKSQRCLCCLFVCLFVSYRVPITQCMVFLDTACIDEQLMYWHRNVLVYGGAPN